MRASGHPPGSLIDLITRAGFDPVTGEGAGGLKGAAARPVDAYPVAAAAAARRALCPPRRGSAPRGRRRRFSCVRPARVAVAPRAVAPSYYVPPPVFAYRYAPSPYEITHNPMHYAAFPEAARRPSTASRRRNSRPTQLGRSFRSRASRNFKDTPTRISAERGAASRRLAHSLDVLTA